MGAHFVKAATIGDFPKLLPFLVIITISTILFNLISGVLYAYLDPRIRLD
jgi:ABC-type dipeptide/oligopeptide/nickel transport system permease component